MCCSKKCFGNRGKLAHKALAGIKCEMKVTEWIKIHRMMKLALQGMYSADDWQELKCKAELT